MGVLVPRCHPLASKEELLLSDVLAYPLIVSSQSNVDNDFACYSFEPKSNIPIKVIAFDNTQREDDTNNPQSLGYGHASLDQKRYDWLVNELDRGQAEDKLMIITAHIPIGVEPSSILKPNC